MADQENCLQIVKSVPVSSWDRLAEKRIFFGHKSVGKNIMDGVDDLLKEFPEIKLEVRLTDDASEWHSGVFAHSYVGENRNPGSKNRAFIEIMEKGVGNKADLAFFKYCYVDITANTDIDRVFQEYKGTLEKLKQKYPSTTFLHFTVPLRALKRPSITEALKSWVREVAGKSGAGSVVEDNIRRNEYNEKMRVEFEEKGHLFDIAKMESTFPDGRINRFSKHGKDFYAMVSEYSDDGGHLNETGRRIVAAEFLAFLASLS